MASFKDFLLKPLPPKKNNLIEEIRNTVTELKNTRSWFDSESDADLIEASIYRLESLEAKYRYLLKIAKDSGVSCDALTGKIA